MRIGVFDSGIGGINVLSCLIKKYPHNEYIYYGDTKNLPYGEKSKEELISLASNIIEFLINQKVDMIIIACGTISSNCYNELKEKYDIPIYDIISPTLNYIKKLPGNIGVIGTNKTIESNIFSVKKDILVKATPQFVPIIENNLILEKKDFILSELSYFKGCQYLVLGCTHYPMLKNIIEENLSLKTIDMGEILSNSIQLTNDSTFKCELYFSLISVNLINNINQLLSCDYQIYAI